MKDDINAALHVARKSAPEQLFVSFATHRKVASAGGFGVHFEAVSYTHLTLPTILLV